MVDSVDVVCDPLVDSVDDVICDPLVGCRSPELRRAPEADWDVTLHALHVLRQRRPRQALAVGR